MSWQMWKHTKLSLSFFSFCHSDGEPEKKASFCLPTLHVVQNSEVQIEYSMQRSGVQKITVELHPPNNRSRKNTS